MKRMTIALCLAMAMLIPTMGQASADPHPEHDQQVFEDGPASDDVGEGRGNPGGSNGTIKIDGVDILGDFDGHPNNEPHIGCVFEVDIYGLDEGDRAVLEFFEWNPTADQDPILTIDTDNADEPGEDGAGGGIDIDDEELVDLAAAVIGEPHPQHGHHIRLDAMITSVDGDEFKKTKVFWTGICETSDTGSGDTGSGDTGGDDDTADTGGRGARGTRQVSSPSGN